MTPIQNEIIPDCPITWEELMQNRKGAEQSSDAEVKYDSINQVYLYGKLWFDYFSDRKIDSTTRGCYVRNYRTNGLLESEGFAEYYEHPIADYSKEGVWIFYNCNGDTLEKAFFDNNKRLHD
jgi:hypothetical protein